MKKIIAIIVIILITIIIALSFISLDSDEGYETNDHIVIAVNDIPKELDKVTNLSNEDENFICATSKGLVELNTDGTIKPSLAKEVNIKDDGIEYEFTIDENKYWSNGKLITAKDIREYFKELLKVEDKENIEPILEVYGAENFKNGISTFEKNVAIYADGNILTIRLNKKNDEFLKELTKPQYRLRSYLPLWANLKNSYEEIFYSGDYYIKDIGEDIIQLGKNTNNLEDTSNKDLVIVKDESVEMSMASYEVGERDIVINPPKSELNRINNTDTLLSFPSKEGVYIGIKDKKNNFSTTMKREIYKNIYKATEEFTEKNNFAYEVSEGNYFRDDKDNLDKLQSRKVSINIDENVEKPKILSLIGIDNETNRSLCKDAVDYFKKNDMQLNYYLTDEQEMIDSQDEYDLVLFNLDEDVSDRDKLFEDMSYVVKDINITDYNKAEEQLFNDYKVLPVMFVNDTIVISDKLSNIDLDGNSNIDFSSIK